MILSVRNYIGMLILSTLTSSAFASDPDPLNLDFLRPADSSISCAALLDVVGSAQWSYLSNIKPTTPITKQVPGIGEVIFDRIIYTGTARTLMSKDASIIMKLYDPQYARIQLRTCLVMGIREYFLLQYLRERGLPVSQPIAKPKFEENPFGTHNVLTSYKHAVRGLSGELIATVDQCVLKKIMSSETLVKALDIGGETQRQYIKMTADPEFRSNFIRWLRGHPELEIDPSHFDPLNADFDASKVSNYVFDFSEWILIDP